MHSHLARCGSLIKEATAGLDDQAGAERPDGRWSIAEIVEHLDRTYTGTIKGFERCLASGPRRGAAATLRNRLRKFIVVDLGVFPTGIAAPKHVVPSGQPALTELLAAIEAHLVQLDAVIAQVVAQCGRGPLLDHPILGPFTATDWMRFHRVHTRHHCRQILARRAARAKGGVRS